jgi:UDP-3-O-[3-hydroxymyristoyl] glucosamine N-acyltransferase
MIDRARFDETTIGDMTALDNLIHVAHNCRVGARTFVAAQTGMAGNAHIGDDCQVGGQVGFANHAGVGDKCLVGAKSGVMKPFPDNSDIAWYPARPRKEIFRLLAKLARE